MTDKPARPVPEAVSAILAQAAEQARAAQAASPETPFDYDPGLASFDGEGEPGTGPDEGTHFDPKNIRECASLDHSDTDNARRLQKHFGQDILVLAQAKAKEASFVVWDGRRWDKETGRPRAIAIAQKLGGAIALEVPHLDFTPDELRLAEAESALHKLELGKAVASAAYDGESVSYSQADKVSLRGYIADLKSQLGLGGGRYRPGLFA